MSDSQKRAVRNYRARLGERGLVRFEVLGLEADRELIRTLVRQLAEEGAASLRLREALHNAMAATKPRTGGILAALRRSPLAGVELNLKRTRSKGRAVDL